MSSLPHQEVVVHEEAWRSQRPAWLYAGLLAGSLTDAASEEEPWPVSLLSLGTIDLATGELVACDPYVADAHQPAFTAQIPTGSHEVLLARTKVGPDHVRNAAAILVTGADVIVRWEMAVTAGANLPTLNDPSSYLGYGVDAGTGCFASPQGQAVATAVLAADGGILEDPLSVALLGSVTGGVVCRPAPMTPPVAVFETGWGDGCYPTWLGIAVSGGVVVAMTDFLLATDPFAPADPAAPATPSAPPTGPLERVVRWLRRRRYDSA